jgi:hypothetical protein
MNLASAPRVWVLLAPTLLLGCDALLGDLYNIDASAPVVDARCDGACGPRRDGSGSGTVSGTGTSPGSGARSGLVEGGVSSGTGGSGTADGGGSGTVPSSIACNAGTCAVPANACCEVVGPTYYCESMDDACGGFKNSCFGTKDCAPGLVCCLSASSFSGGSAMCQEGPCPAAPESDVFSAQLCSSAQDCVGCTSYLCTKNGITMDVTACAGTPMGGGNLSCMAVGGPDGG